MLGVLLDGGRHAVGLAAEEGGELKRINRGFSARRYVNNLTKNWDQDVLDKFISNGQINKNTIYEPRAEKEAKRKRVDDLTAMPQVNCSRFRCFALPLVNFSCSTHLFQVYRLDRTSLKELNSHRIYKFIKTHDLVKGKQSWQTWLDQRSLSSGFLDEASGEAKVKFKQKVIDLESIKVVDKQSTELNYKILNPVEKRKVLSELLFQSAISNIMKNQIVSCFSLQSRVLLSKTLSALTVT